MVSVKPLLQLQRHQHLAFLEASLASAAAGVLLLLASGRNPFPLQLLRLSPVEPAFSGQDPRSILLVSAALQAGKVPRPPRLVPGR